MNFSIVLSLKRLTLIKIAITLCNQDDIRALLYDVNFFLEERLKEIEVKARSKVLCLPYPESLKKAILYFIRPISIEILEWMDQHGRQICIYEKFPKILCWTLQGTVDGKKTAEVLTAEENLDITKRYILACVYCLEDNIPKLWNKMSENRKKYFLCRYDNIKELFCIRHKDLVLLWTYIVAGEEDRVSDAIKKGGYNCSLYQWAFKCAIKADIKAATEYFMKKLAPREINEALLTQAVFSASTTGCFDVLYFLISNMNEEKRLEVCRNRCYLVLSGLLKWPWQNFYMESANCMWDFLPKKDYKCLLTTIAFKIKNDHGDYDYENLFEEFWQNSPYLYKKYVIKKITESSALKFLKYLWHLKNIRNISLILKSADIIEKRRIFSSFMDACFWEELNNSNDFDLLTVFIHECVVSQGTMREFKEELIDYLAVGRGAWNKKKLDSTFQLLDECIFEYDKREELEWNDIPSE